MSRPDTGEGFAVMDVSTAILDDEKFQQLALEAPDLYDGALVGYMATLARSWKKGRRLTVHDAWPKYRPVNLAAIEALIKVQLLDAKGCIPARSWREWFGPARKRRDESRERWRRAQQTRRERLAAEHESPRAVSDDTPRVPRESSTTVRPSVPTVPTEPIRSASADSRAIDDDDLDPDRDEEALVLQYLASVHATVQPTGNGYHKDIVTLVGRRGAPAVVEAMRRRHAAGDRSARQLIYGAANDLEPIHRGATAPTPKGAGAQDLEAVEARFR